MKTRARIAAELLNNCPAGSFAEHVSIAVAIARGDSLKDILKMKEKDLWPETFCWLEEELKYPAAACRLSC